MFINTPKLKEKFPIGSGGDDGKLKGEPVCQKPYMRLANNCCLDQNDNNICDADDKQIEEEKAKEEAIKKANEEKAGKAAALTKMNERLSQTNVGMGKEKFEEVIGFKAAQCIGKTRGTECSYRTEIDGFLITFIAVYDYDLNVGGFNYVSGLDASKI